jgi:hypothetical protein
VAAALHDGSSRVVIWTIEGSVAHEEWVSDPEPGLFTVRLVHVPDAGPVACGWCLAPGGSRVVVLGPSVPRNVIDGFSEPCPVVRPDGELVVAGRVGETVALGPSGPIPVSEPGGRVFSPSAACLDDGSLLVAWEQERAPGCGIASRRILADGTMDRVLVLDDGDATAHVPCVTPQAGGGALVAWHAPALFAAPQLLVKDLRLVLVRAGEVLHPRAGSAPDPGPEPSGEDQGFEFPVPLARPDGSVHVVGRGSHSYLRRVLDASGWGPLERLDEHGWGCRGPSIRASAGEAGVWGVTREKARLVLRCLDPPPGSGPASFERRTLSCAGPGPEVLERCADPVRDRDGYATWFGDIHQHSAFSDGTGAPHEAYVRARDFYSDDVVALSDHESFLGKRTPVGEWRYLVELAGRFDEPGAFATLVAYEWTGRMTPGPGHKVVYPGGGEPGLVSRDDPGADSGSGLLEAVAGSGGFAVPHHVGWTGADEEAHRPRVQPCFEVVSCHGSYENRSGGPIGHRDPVQGPFIIELLRRGLRFGLVGGSDGHGLLYHHGVSRRRDSHRTGLTAVMARTLSRDEVLGALRERRVYATSGARIWLRLWVDGWPMGSEVGARGSRVHAQVEVRAGAELESVSLVMADGEEEIETGGRDVAWSGTLRVRSAGPSFVYLRVVRKDGECAWSSPVFID